MRKRIFVLIVLGAAALASCSGSRDSTPFTVLSMAVPTGEVSLGARLESGHDGRLILSWMAPGKTATALRFARLEDGAWSGATTVAEDADMFVNWADLPSVVSLGDGQLGAHWLTRSGAATYAYDIAYTQSLDDGRTWSEPMTPHSDGTRTEHGFVSMIRHGSQVALVWLDGRKMVNDVTDDPMTSGMTLRAAMIDEETHVSRDQVVDALICDCCQTDIAMTIAGPIAVYRDRSAEEIRDIAVTRLIDERWLAGTTIASDNWHIAGCPVNGPAITADGADVAVAWFTAANDPTVKLAWSDDAGASFAAPVEVIRSATDGRVGVALLADSRDAAVSWLHTTAEGSALLVRRVGSDGSLGPARVVSDAVATVSVPQMERSGNWLVFAWTEETAQGKRVATGRIAVEAL